MTEEEAKQKWCPFVTLVNFTGCDGYQLIYDNRGRNDGKYSCLGSMCMAWAWKMPDRKKDGYCGMVKLGD